MKVIPISSHKDYKQHHELADVDKIVDTILVDAAWSNETTFLLGTPENARRLFESIDQIKGEDNES